MKVAVIGAGQLGRMLALAGYPLGIRCEFYDRSADTPGAQVGAITTGEFDDIARLAAFAARADVLALVQTAIEQMDPIDREVLALRHFEEMSNSEVAETLGIEQKAASIRYIRALRRLKAIMAQVPDLADGPHHA